MGQDMRLPGKPDIIASAGLIDTQPYSSTPAIVRIRSTRIDDSRGDGCSAQSPERTVAANAVVRSVQFLGPIDGIEYDLVRIQRADPCQGGQTETGIDGSGRWRSRVRAGGLRLEQHYAAAPQAQAPAALNEKEGHGCVPLLDHKPAVLVSDCVIVLTSTVIDRPFVICQCIGSVWNSYLHSHDGDGSGIDWTS